MRPECRRLSTSSRLVQFRQPVAMRRMEQMGRILCFSQMGRWPRRRDRILRMRLMVVRIRRAVNILLLGSILPREGSIHNREENIRNLTVSHLLLIRNNRSVRSLRRRGGTRLGFQMDG